MNDFDVVIIGSGTAGQTAAYDLLELGKNVAVVEKSDTPGGVSALAGCQAKKWFYEAMEAAARSKHLLDKGVIRQPEISWQQVVDEKNRFTSNVPQSTLKAFEKAGIAVLKGSARFIDSASIEVDGKPYSDESFIIAAGAKPMNLPFAGSELMINSDEFLSLQNLPERFIFIGGGFISFEFAHFVSQLSESEKPEITILEAASRPLGPFDEEMVEQLVIASEMEDIDIQTDIKISSIEKNNNGLQVVIEDDEPIEADIIVNAAGRIADLEGLDLEKAGVTFNRRGIVVDHNMQTSVPNIYAIGDCAATIQLARVADQEAHIAANHIANQSSQSNWPQIDYSSVAAVLFTYPQYAMVGKTEQSLMEEGIDYVKSEGYDLSWPTYRRIGMNHAAYKILTTPSGKLLGAHFISDNASGMVNTIRLAMLNNISADQLYQQMVMAPYPSRESDMSYMLKPFFKH